MSRFILVEKLYLKHNRFTDIAAIIGEDNIIRLNKGILVSFWILCNKINFDEIGYTYDDFLKDYAPELEIFKEKKLVYKIWKSGHSIHSFAKMRGFYSSNLIRTLKNGITKDHKKSLELLRDLIDVQIDITLLSKFEVIIHDSYCKLIGLEQDLRFFKEKYEIRYPILPYKNIFHLAFDGYIFNIIKEIKQNSIL